MKRIMKDSTNRSNELFEKSFNSGRFGGILLHPSSLPSKYGIGDLGPELYKFIDTLKIYKQNLWQILPLGPTGYDNSPYQCFSTFAGNPMLISPKRLYDMQLLSEEEYKPPDLFPEIIVDYEKVIPYKWQLLERAFKNFLQNQPSLLKREFSNFIIVNSFWLDDYSLFMAIKKAYNFKPWIKWEDDLRFRDANALESWKKEHRNDIEFQKFTQFIFFNQWKDIKEYTNLKKIYIIGDIPIFVAYDSVDVWTHPEYYFLDKNKNLLYVAGVPPDYFSSKGQRWGNPLYNWNIMKKDNYQWWTQRIKYNLDLVDILRIDHFRGFESYWQINASEETAVAGEWIQGPGLDLFLTLEKEIGFLPIIAENLGLITPEVENLLQKTGYAGMRVLQFAFSGTYKNFVRNKNLPHHYQYNTIAYTGTHDNDTTKSWFENQTTRIKRRILNYTNSDGKDIVCDLIHLIWSSVAKMAIIPLQDLLRLDNQSRMNLPGTTHHNWEWRFTWDQFTKDKGKQLRKFSKLYDRI